MVLFTRKRAKNPKTGIIITSRNDHSTIMFPNIYDFESLHFPPIATRARIIATIMKGKYTSYDVVVEVERASQAPVVVFPT